MPKKSIFKKSERVCMLMVCTGLLMLTAGSLLRGNEVNNRLFEFLGGVGGAIVAVGSVSLIRLRVNPKSVKEQEISDKDERNIKIREKSAYSTFFITLIALSITELVFVVLDNVTACFVVTIVMGIHVLSYLLLLHFNNNKL